MECQPSRRRWHSPNGKHAVGKGTGSPSRLRVTGDGYFAMVSLRLRETSFTQRRKENKVVGHQFEEIRIVTPKAFANFSPRLERSENLG